MAAPSATRVSLVGATLTSPVRGVRSEAPGGALVLRDVVVTGALEAGIHASTGSPVLERVTAAEGASYGFWFAGDAQPTLTRLVGRGNGSAGLYLNQSSAVSTTVDHGSFHANGAGGISINVTGGDYKTFAISHCAVTRNTNGGVKVTGQNVDTTIAWSDVWPRSIASIVTVGPGVFAFNPLYVSETDLTPTSRSPLRHLGDQGQEIGAQPYEGSPTPQLVGYVWDDLVLPSGTYPLAGDLVVPAGHTLTLLAGTRLTWATGGGDVAEAGAFTSEPEIGVEGRLVVSGTQIAPVTASVPGGIRFLAGAEAPEGSWLTLTANKSTAIQWDGPGDATWRHLTVSTSALTAFRILGGSHRLEYVTIYGGDTNLEVKTPATADLYGCLLADAPKAALLPRDRPWVLDQSTFEGTVCTSISTAEPHEIRNSILLATTPQCAASTTVSYSDVLGPAGASTQGVGTFTANPLFATGGWALTSNSPARFAGDSGQDIGAFPYGGAPTVGVQGVLWEDTTWGPGTVTLAGDVRVPEDRTLTIVPGTTVVATGTDNIDGWGDRGIQIDVAGTLRAIGTGPDSILLTGKTTTFDGLHFSPSSSGSFVQTVTLHGAYNGLMYEGGGTDVITGVTVRNGYIGYQPLVDDPPIERLTIRTVSRGVQLAQERNLTLSHAVLREASTPIYVLTTGAATGVVVLDHCTVADFAFNPSGQGLASLRFVDSIVDGIDGPLSNVTLQTTFTGLPLFVSATDERLTRNSPARYGASDGGAYGAFPYDGAPALGLYGTLWEDLTLAGGQTHLVQGDLTVAPGATLSVEPGARVQFQGPNLSSRTYSPSLTLRVNGRLVVNGDPFERVAFVGDPQMSEYVRFGPTSAGSVMQHADLEMLISHESASDQVFRDVHLTGDTTFRVTAGHPTADGLRVTTSTIAVSVQDGAGLTLSNCVLVSEFSSLYLSQSGSVDVSFCTVANSGTAVHATSGTGAITIADSVIVGNTNGMSSAVASPHPIAITRSIVVDPSGRLAPYFGSGVLTVSPLLDADLRPGPGSPAIDAVPAGPTHDAGWRPRPFDGDHDGTPAWDLGGWEHYEVIAGVIVDIVADSSSEAGGDAAVDVRLAAAPLGPVTIGLVTTRSTEGIVEAGSLAFTPSTWDTPQRVVVHGVDDLVADGDQAYDLLLDTSGSLDEAYALLDPTAVGLTNHDDDVASLHVAPLALSVREGVPTQLGVRLTSEPLAPVRVDFRALAPAAGSVLPSSLTFTASNWSTTRTVNVLAASDTGPDDVSWQIELGTGLSTDATYKVMSPTYVDVTTLGAEEPALLASPEALTTTEAGGVATIAVALGSRPDADVTVTPTVSDPSEATVAGSPTFTASTWSVPQHIVVTGVDDDEHDGDQAFTVTLTAASTDGAYAALPPVVVQGTNTDDDVAGVTVSPTSVMVTEGGDTARLTVSLGARPTHPLSVPVASLDTSEATVSASMLTFTPTDWSPRTVDVVGADDPLVDPATAFTIRLGPITTDDAAYAALAPVEVPGTCTDDDHAGLDVIAEPLTTTERGGTANFTVALTARPAAPVTVPIASDDPSEATVTPDALVIQPADWATPVTVTVTGVNDGVTDGDAAYTVHVGPTSSTDAAWNLPAVHVPGTNRDASAPEILVDAPAGGLRISEDGGQDAFTLVLTDAPVAEVRVAVTVGDDTEADVSPAEVVFLPSDWDQPRPITVSGIDDAVVDGDVVFDVEIGPSESDDPAFDGLAAASVPGTCTDDDVAGVRVSPFSGLSTTEAGGMDAFDVWLDAEPSATVTVTLTASDDTEGWVLPAALHFGPLDWSVAQTVEVGGVDDARDDGAVSWRVHVEVTSNDALFDGQLVPDVLITTADDDEAGISVAPTSGHVTTELGGASTFDVVLTSEPLADVRVDLASLDATEVSVSPATLTFTPVDWSVPRRATVTGLPDGVPDGDASWTVMTAPAYSTDAGYLLLDPPDVTGSNLDVAAPSGQAPATGRAFDTLASRPDRLDDPDTADPEDTGAPDDSGCGGCTKTPPGPWWSAILALAAIGSRRNAPRRRERSAPWPARR